MGEDNRGLEQAKAQLANVLELVAALDGENHEDARQAIHEDALSVETRSDWRAVGSSIGPCAEYRVVLCTGGPHVEIRGRLSLYGEPESAELYYSDWFKGLAPLNVSASEEQALLAYSNCFYFGE